MSNPVKIVTTLTQSAADLLVGYSGGAKLYLYSSATEAGIYALITSTALVSGTEQYEQWDPTGTGATWYKTRVGNSGATVFGDYSTALQGTALAAYATIDDVVRGMDLPDESRYPYLSDLLADVSAEMDADCDRDFYRHPQVSGDETRYYDIPKRGIRWVTEDILSITTLSVAEYTGGSYAAIAAGSAGYYLRPSTAGHGTALAAGWPYERVVLSDLPAAYLWFPVGLATVKIVGAFGWSAVPAAVRRAVVDMTRERYRQGPGGGGQTGVSALGQPIWNTSGPRSWGDAVESFRRHRYSEFM